MAWSLDARLPLVMAESEAALAALLADGVPSAVLAEAPPPAELPLGAVALVSFDAFGAAHVAGCSCCGGRNGAALALDRLFQARVRSAAGWFTRVVAWTDSEAARDAVRAALHDDAVTAARFRAG